MRREVNAISNRLSLRPPQRAALEILDRVTELVPPKEKVDLETALAMIQSEYPSVTDFEREFPSLCFALATGVGKTRLMGAFISYLHEAHGIDNFFVLAPNLTIYNKLIADFTPGSPKYVFTGISSFATQAPQIITGDNYEASAGTLFDRLIRCKVNIFNISKINTEVRGGASPRIKRLSEYLGESYFDYLANLPDLVLLMDESHRYRASAGIRAINELKPILGLELTATPYVTSGTRTTPFRNVIYDYPLRKAMEDGFVKEPAVVTRKDFQPAGVQPAELERMKLGDGIRLHEQTKVQLATYARDRQQEIVKPFLLVIARDTTHASELMALIQSDGFFSGQYAAKVIQVDSSGRGEEKDETVERLLRVEKADEPTEIVIHVNMLKEGWDVTNLYTIVPLRAANARVLIEQSIGRGLRLPYGKRTGVAEVDRLSIVAHDKFQEIVDEARRDDSIIQLQTIVLDEEQLNRRLETVVVRPLVEELMAEIAARNADAAARQTGVEPQILAAAELDVLRIVDQIIQKEQRNPEQVPDVTYLSRPEVQKRLVAEARETYFAGQMQLDGIAPVDVERAVEQMTSLVIGQTISIPRIIVVPVGEVRAWFDDFELDTRGLTYQAPSDELWVQSLRTEERQIIGLSPTAMREKRLEDYIVSGLINFDDVPYDQNADLLYELAEQAVAHFRGYLDERDVERVLQYHQRAIADFIHSQMQPHFHEETGALDTVVRSGFVPMKPCAYTSTIDPHDFKKSPADKSKMSQYLFGGFTSCLYPLQKFHSDPERKLAVVLDRDAERWFRPVSGQFQMTYRLEGDLHGYQPDFVAEMGDRIAMIEVKARNQMTNAEVLAKQHAGVTWCGLATEHTASYSGKPWIYALIPAEGIAENLTASFLLRQYAIQPALA